MTPIPPQSRWYDRFSNVYDLALDGIYRDHRARARAALKAAHGMTVADVGCGTGASFHELIDAVGPEGRVVGLDASAGMLARAADRARRHGWDNVTLLNVTSPEGRDPAEVARALGRLDRVHCFLSLSVIPNWASVLASWWAALPAGGRLVIGDVYNARPGLYARLVEKTAEADLTRRTWSLLEAEGADFEIVWQKPDWRLGGAFFVASATRPPQR